MQSFFEVNINFHFCSFCFWMRIEGRHILSDSFLLKDIFYPFLLYSLRTCTSIILTTSSHLHPTIMGSAFQELHQTQTMGTKGKGLVALVAIKQGTRIISEQPHLNLSERGSEDEIEEKLKALPTKDQEIILSLSNNFSDVSCPLEGLVSTNSLPLGDTERCGIFTTICRINHNCLPNTHFSWNDPCGNIHALQDISVGEEITIRYDDREPRLERRTFLKDHFGFDCNCDLCSDSLINIHRSDSRRRRITYLEKIIADQVRRAKKF